MIELVKGDTQVKESISWMTTGDVTPYHFIKDGKKYFIGNLITNSTVWACDNDSQRAKVSRWLKCLRSSDYKYITFNGLFINPIDLLQWVKESGRTLRDPQFVKGDSFTDFIGNVVERSSSFHYRIYDEELLNKIKSCVIKP